MGVQGDERGPPQAAAGRGPEKSCDGVLQLQPGRSGVRRAVRATSGPGSLGGSLRLSEIQPVHLKGIPLRAHTLKGLMSVEAQHWPPDTTSQLTGKDPMGKIEGTRGEGGNRG